MFDAEVDIVIAGAGGCGLAAALAASTSQLDIAVFEKTDRIFGNTAMSAGLIPAAGTRFQQALSIPDTPDIMAEDILKKNAGESSEKLVYALCRESPRLIEWLSAELNIELSLLEEFKYPGQRYKRMHGTPSKSGAELIKLLVQQVKRRDNIYLTMKSEVIDVILDDDRNITGIKVLTNKTEQRIKCKKLILATNGFGANKGLIKQYIPHMAEALYFGYEANDGQAVHIGEKIGAQLENMTAYQGHSSVVENQGILLTWGAIMLGGFIVNKEGKRFGDETKGYSEFAKELMKQTDQKGYALFNQEIYNELMVIDDFKQLCELRAFKEADTLQQLAKELDVDVDSIAQTFDKFIQCRKNNSKDEFGRSSFKSALSGPLYGVKITPALFHTQGGLKINEYAQVLDKENTPIPHVYAGGGAAAGISGKHDYGYMSGNGLLSALGLGKIAGQHAMQEILNSRIYSS
ncbi:FAD-dependent oxidoreductase [Fictibacillus enclensis]|uniref:FAD-dependent oxidoreductase n=1 Tax=Fictibacillus enclensis TaxID=1017270 RepID=UPI0025A1CAD1|nr:FAD-dependent oxidoreductase [Fictibacillus enclensis]MDM5336627.1 FAD-dependent oxidoreductase [Fictibacillus enclensis]